jgi:hypothetical protein
VAFENLVHIYHGKNLLSIKILFFRIGAHLISSFGFLFLKFLLVLLSFKILLTKMNMNHSFSEDTEQDIGKEEETITNEHIK